LNDAEQITSSNPPKTPHWLQLGQNGYNERKDMGENECNHDVTAIKQLP
jgi:hypothetical protein